MEGTSGEKAAMARLLFWVLVALGAYLLAKRWIRPGAPRAHRQGSASEAMVRCAACGLNVPQSEAHAREGQWYCSREHLQQARPGGTA